MIDVLRILWTIVRPIHGRSRPHLVGNERRLLMHNDPTDFVLGQNRTLSPVSLEFLINHNVLILHILELPLWRYDIY